MLTTHYLEEAEALADRVVVLAKGRVVASGSVAEMRALVVRTRITCISALAVERSAPGPAWGAPAATGSGSRSPPPTPRPLSANCCPTTKTCRNSKSGAPDLPKCSRSPRRLRNERTVGRITACPGYGMDVGMIGGDVLAGRVRLKKPQTLPGATDPDAITQ